MSRFIDLTGQRFGRLIAIEPVKVPNYREFHWKCKCDCGNMTTVRGTHLKSGATRSCGCYNREVASSRPHEKTHGMSKHPLYRAYRGMIDRCMNPNGTAYKNYGGRGIKICDEWLNDRTRFFEWALANGWSPDLSLDRIDVNGNYCPENCRWATAKTQMNNRRVNAYVTYKGKTQTIAQWAEEIGINRRTLRGRLHNERWTLEEAMTLPAHKGRKLKNN